MLRRAAVVAAATLIPSLVLLPRPASAGAGCYAGPTQGTGDTVRLADMCPSPSILRIEPGTTVTFVNDDPMVHNVIGLGLQWGHPKDLQPGHAFTETFTKPGIYPYACWYHWGMVGAIVVGAGTGAGNGATVTEGTAPAASPVAAALANEPAPERTGSNAVGWIVAGAVGLALGGLAGSTLRRRRESARA